MFFRDIIGQEEIKKHLIQSVKSGQIPHARLFYGPDGIGKLAMAVAYARYLNCTNRGEEESCGTCPSCKHITSLMHPDLNFVFPIYKSAKLKKRISDDYITEWRKALSETHYLSLEHWLSIIGAENAQPKIYTDESSEIIRKLSFKSFESEYKVMIIWHPELMVDECANKLLKIIEEPYNKTIFLLVSNRPDIILPTILSRTQRLNFRKIPNEEIATELVRHFSVEPSDAANVARISNGSYRKAMEIMQQTGENELFFELFTKMMRNSYARRIKEMKQWS
ncbi:MAG: DNA polymerase III subunit, partial [Bacteroidales bacterium]